MILSRRIKVKVKLANKNISIIVFVTSNLGTEKVRKIEILRGWNILENYHFYNDDQCRGIQFYIVMRIYLMWFADFNPGIATNGTTKSVQQLK